MGSQKPTVSAIITAYNGAAYVADAIESALAQTCPVDEIVVVDDGSSDNTFEIVDSYRTRGVRCIRQENRGLPRARNRGISETSGDLIAFLDCDDIWLPEKNELEVEYLANHPDAALVTGHAWRWDPIHRARRLAHLGVKQSKLRREILVNNCIGNASGVLVRRRILDQVGGFDPAQIWAEDWELWMRIVARSKVGFIDRPLILYRVVPTSLTHQRGYERAVGYFHLSASAIKTFQPSWWRPILLLRALSRRELFSATAAWSESAARRTYLAHATKALFAYPFEATMLKLKHFARAAVGPAPTRWYRRLMGAPKNPEARPLGR
jgi:glycosyltransferase involved in cell wall biosynthesis